MSEKPNKKPGRPAAFTPEQRAEVVAYACQELSKGIFLTVICRGEAPEAKRKPGDLPMPAHLPDPATVWRWEQEDPAVAQSIAQARARGEEAIIEDCLAIADSPAVGVSEKYERRMIDNPDDPGGEQVEEFVLAERRVEDMLGHRKLQVETRLKVLAKMNPKRWGEKVEVKGAISLERLVAGSYEKKPGGE